MQNQSIKPFDKILLKCHEEMLKVCANKWVWHAKIQIPDMYTYIIYSHTMYLTWINKLEIFCFCLFNLCKQINTLLMVFSFLPKNVHFISKNAISCLFLKNVLPSKRVICFILNNLHFPMVEGIAFYALHKSRVLIIPCKAYGFCLFIGLPDEILKMSPGIVFHFRI